MDFCQNVLPDGYPVVAADAPVPLSEIDAELRKEYNAEQIAPSAIPWLSMHLFNAFHLPSNDALKLTKDQMQIKAIKIPITQKTRKYRNIQKRLRSCRAGSGGGRLYFSGV